MRSGRESGHLSGHPPGHRRGRRTLAGRPEPSFPFGSAETNLAVHRHMHGEGGHKIHAEIERCVCETGGGLLRHIDGTNAGTEPSPVLCVLCNRNRTDEAQPSFWLVRVVGGWRWAMEPRQGHSPQRQQPGAMPKGLSQPPSAGRTSRSSRGPWLYVCLPIRSITLR